MKKFLKISLPILAIVIVLGGLVFGIVYQSNYSQKELDAVKGGVTFEAQKTELEAKLVELRDAIKSSNNDYIKISESYMKLLDELAQNGAQLKEMEAEREATMIVMRESLTSLQSIYTEELTTLNAQIVEIDANITELSSLPGDHTAEIATLQGAKARLQSDVDKYNAQIERINKQLADISGGETI